MADQLRVEAIVGFRLVTQDLEHLVRFYHDVLGFTVCGPIEPIDRNELSLLGLAGAGRRQHLRLGEQSLALDQFEAPGRSYPPDSDAASLWFQHLAMIVVDIQAAYARLRDVAPISKGGPQHLPPASGSVDAFKFRDPDGHPLEFLQFPAGDVPEAWRDKSPAAAGIAIGIDHSAISVSDSDASARFYAAAGLRQGDASLNQGVTQQNLDGLRDVEVAVVPMLPQGGTPHLELLGYRVPRGQAGAPSRANDVAATRILWRGSKAALMADPDGHLQQIEAG